MPGSSDDIAVLLAAFTDDEDPAPKELPAIFRDIVERLDVAGVPYAVLGRIALTLHEQARFVREIEIVADLGEDRQQRAAALVHATETQFARFMEPRRCAKPIRLSLRPCTSAIEAQLLVGAIVCSWFGVTARLASAEHLLWLWCRSDSLDHRIDASALIGGSAVDLYRVLRLLRETDDVEESGQTRLRLAIGDAVLASECTFSRYQEEKRRQRKPDRIPVWRLHNDAGKDG